MNAAARAARRRYLWFLHADTRFGPGVLAALRRSLAAEPEGLHYFDLGFAPGGPALMPVNAAGVWVRSRLLGMPFGDQGFCLSRRVFARLGGFDEEASYGEDHLLVWKARRAGVPLRCAGARLLTSARKYQERGWLATTARHLYLTYKQALPELLKYGTEEP
jgi:GT2 family glycosyltransferase